MKCVMNAMRIAAWVIAVCIGLIGVVGFFWKGLYAGLANWLVASPGSVVGLLGGIVLIALAGASGWLLLQNARRDHLEFETTRGRILVGLGALQDSLGRALLDEASVREADVTILDAHNTNKPLRIYGQVGIYERGDLVGLQKHLQEILEERFRDMLAVERDVRYDIELVRIRARGSKAESEEEEFRGPQYPVDG